MSRELIFTPTDFVAVFNQTLETVYPSVSIEGELANFRVSKGKWVYFDLKDEYSSLKFFGTVYQLPGPLEDGLMLRVAGVPRLHPLYGFSVNVVHVQPIGEGSIRKSAALLEAKLAKEGLFDEARKRSLPYPPRRIGLITSSESAAYGDFIKILDARWAGLDIVLADVQVQGDKAPGQIIRALEYLNTQEEELDAIVITRGGGSPEDLAAFSTEQVVRAVAASRVPTLVAIGHETDMSLAELAADRRASTPSNAAELLVPDGKNELVRLEEIKKSLHHAALRVWEAETKKVVESATKLHQSIKTILKEAKQQLENKRKLLVALSPAATLARGYSIIRYEGRAIDSVKQLARSRIIDIEVQDGHGTAIIE